MKQTQTLLTAAALSIGLITATGTDAALVTTLGGQVLNDTDPNITSLAGWADTGRNAQHAFLYSNGSILDLNNLVDPNSGWTLTAAQGSNDFGWTADYSSLNGQIHALVMSAMSDAGLIGLNSQIHALVMSSLSAVPVPAAVWLLVSGLIGLAGIACKRKAI